MWFNQSLVKYMAEFWVNYSLNAFHYNRIYDSLQNNRSTTLNNDVLFIFCKILF